MALNVAPDRGEIQMTHAPLSWALRLSIQPAT